ncbi:MAG: hypothetical protein HUU22_07750 [Phycisphaerae bacterium]|nr:hypothetical protein [Phycisphaerae bacterium]NUQ45912.1 hypothetical protein [Phycisphaerae bacterium]
MDNESADHPCHNGRSASQSMPGRAIDHDARNQRCQSQQREDDAAQIDLSQDERRDAESEVAASQRHAHGQKQERQRKSGRTYIGHSHPELPRQHHQQADPHPLMSNAQRAQRRQQQRRRSSHGRDDKQLSADGRFAGQALPQPRERRQRDVKTVVMADECVAEDRPMQPGE